MDWAWLQKLTENFGAAGLIAFVVWKIVDKWAGQFLAAQNAQAQATAALGAAVREGQVDQREILIGDAGGFASRLHGGGMSNGMSSGRDVAKKILDPDYPMPEVKRVLKTKKQEERLLNLAEKLPVWLQNLLLKFLIKVISNQSWQKRIKII